LVFFCHGYGTRNCWLTSVAYREIRNSNIEILNKFKFSKFKCPKLALIVESELFRTLENSDFGFVSCFVLLISDFDILNP